MAMQSIRASPAPAAWSMGRAGAGVPARAIQQPQISMPCGPSLSFVPPPEALSQASFAPPPQAQAAQVVMGNAPVRRGMSPPPPAPSVTPSMSMSRLAPNIAEATTPKPRLFAAPAPAANDSLRGPARAQPTGSYVPMPIVSAPPAASDAYASYAPIVSAPPAPYDQLQQDYHDQRVAAKHATYAHVRSRPTSPDMFDQMHHETLQQQNQAQPEAGKAYMRSPSQHRRLVASSTTPPKPMEGFPSPQPAPRRPSQKSQVVTQEGQAPCHPGTSARDATRGIQEAQVTCSPAATAREAYDDREQRIEERRLRKAEQHASARAGRSSHYDRKLHELSTQLTESKHANRELQRALTQMEEDYDAERGESAKLMREAMQLRLKVEQRDQEGAALRRKGDESVEAKKKQLEALELQLEAQAHRLGEAERGLPEREREVRLREAAQTEREAAMLATLSEREAALLKREAPLAEREAMLSKREAALAEREAKSGEDVEQLNAEKARLSEELAAARADQEAQVEQLSARESQIDSRERNLVERESQIDNEEGRYSQAIGAIESKAKQLEEREKQHIEACKEAQALGSVRRLGSGGAGKENNELWKQLEEQKDRMHNIKQLGWKQKGPETGVL